MGKILPTKLDLAMEAITRLGKLDAKVDQMMLDEDKIITQIIHIINKGEGGELSIEDAYKMAEDYETKTGNHRLEALKSIEIMLQKGIRSKKNIMDGLEASFSTSIGLKTDIVTATSTYAESFNGNLGELEKLMIAGAFTKEEFEKLSMHQGSGDSAGYRGNYRKIFDKGLFGGLDKTTIQGDAGLYTKTENTVHEAVRHFNLGGWLEPDTTQREKAEAQLADLKDTKNRIQSKLEGHLSEGERKITEAIFQEISKNIDSLTMLLEDLDQGDREASKRAHAKETQAFKGGDKQESVSESVQSEVAKSVEKISASCPFAGKNIEDICFKCECDCSEKGEAPKEELKPKEDVPEEPKGKSTLPSSPEAFASGGSAMGNHIPTFAPTDGQGQLPFMGLTDLFTGEIETWTTKFDFLNTSVSKMFGGWQKDLLSVFSQGNFSIETFANKLLNLSANNPLQGFFGQLQGYMSSLSSMNFGGGGGGGFLGGLMNIAGSAIGAYFGYSAPVSSGGTGGGGNSAPPVSGHTMVAHDGGIVGNIATTRYAPASLFANAPKFHSGGWLGPGERPIIAKDGELILNAAQQRNVAGRMNGSINVTVPVIVENHSKEKVQSQEETGPDGKKQIRMLIGDAVKKGIASGQFDTSMNRAYGLSRKGY